MKKIILLLVFFIFLTLSPVNADIVPSNSKSIKHFGIGVINVENSYNVYANPSLDSLVIRKVDNANIKKTAIVKSPYTKPISYITYVPTEKIALLAVESDNGDNWYNIFLNQQTGETGWIYNENPNNFMTYKNLFYKYGKQYGLRIFPDVPEDGKKIYAKESKTSQILNELTNPKFVNFTVIRGNWMLVSVNDCSEQAKVGWFNWRNEDGSLNMFPYFKEQH